MDDNFFKWIAELSLRSRVWRAMLIVAGATISMALSYFHKKNRRKIKPKEIPSCLISCLPAVFTLQLEILMTTLGKPKPFEQMTIFLSPSRSNGWQFLSNR